MAIALNVFKTVTAELTTTPTTIYTAPSGYDAIILMAQISNVTATATTVTFSHVDGSTTTELVKDFPVPGNDAVAATTGKLVIQSSHSIQSSAAVNGRLKLTLSVLETSNA